jgi:hypothetical protein
MTSCALISPSHSLVFASLVVFFLHVQYPLRRALCGPYRNLEPGAPFAVHGLLFVVRKLVSTHNGKRVPIVLLV